MLTYEQGRFPKIYYDIKHVNLLCFCKSYKYKLESQVSIVVPLKYLNIVIQLQNTIKKYIVFLISTIKSDLLYTMYNDLAQVFNLLKYLMFHWWNIEI